MILRHWSVTAVILSLSAALSLTACKSGKACDPEGPSAPDVSALPEAGSLQQGGCAAGRAAARRHQAGKRIDENDPGLTMMRQSSADTDVLHYNLDVEIFPASQEIAGTNTMTIKSLVDGLAAFTFRLHSNFTITSANINAATPATIKQISETTRQAVLDRSYDAGEIFTLAITYEGSPAALGFGSVQFQKHNGVDVVYTFSCPYYAYTWWPCKDGNVGEPGDNQDKATVELAVTAPNHMRTVSNGLLQGVDTLPDSRRRHRWATNYPVATYLVCFSSTSYVTWTATYDYGTGTMPVEFNIYPETDSPETRARLEKTLTMLETFRPLFGLYPFINEKYGIYEFEFGGGMEHQTNTGQGSFSTSLIAHELAHQWWGDAITCRTWHDAWLNEGFATYSEALWKEHQPGSSGAEALHSAMAELRPSRVDDSVYCYDTSDFSRIFDGAFTYRKAAWVLHQLRHVVGDETFFQILAAYRAAFEGAAASTEDFIEIVSAVSGRDLTWFFNQWVYEIGAPAYRYGWQSEQINGQHYLRLHVNQVQDPSWVTFSMPLDVRVDYDGGSRTYVVFNDAENVAAGPRTGRLEHFVLPIPGPATGVVLDELNWVLHTSLAEEPHVPGPPVVVQASPLPGETILWVAPASRRVAPASRRSARPNPAPAQITITFSEDVNASATDFAVTEASAGPVTFALSYSASNYTATLDFGEPLSLGSYTVTVSDSIQSTNGIALDGEINDPLDPQSFPSGEGLSGGEAIFTFVVRRPGDLNWVAPASRP